MIYIWLFEKETLACMADDAMRVARSTLSTEGAKIAATLALDTLEVIIEEMRNRGYDISKWSTK